MLRNEHRLHQTGLVGTLLVSLLIMGGCPNPKVGFDSPAPTKRMDAIAQAADQTDEASRRMLVEKLGSEDPSERMLAIRALEKREGTTLGYDHAAPDWERLEAIQEWRTRIGLSDNTDDSDGSPMNTEP
ncbi:MAG: hypothetical protein AB8C13_06885 [Phycisphaerales bacterium]